MYNNKVFKLQDAFTTNSFAEFTTTDFSLKNKDIGLKYFVERLLEEKYFFYNIINESCLDVKKRVRSYKGMFYNLPDIDKGSYHNYEKDITDKESLLCGVVRCDKYTEYEKYLDFRPLCSFNFFSPNKYDLQQLLQEFVEKFITVEDESFIRMVEVDFSKILRSNYFKDEIFLKVQNPFDFGGDTFVEVNWFTENTKHEELVKSYF